MPHVDFMGSEMKKNPAKPLMDFIAVTINFEIKTQIDDPLYMALCVAATLATHLIHLPSIFVFHKKIPFPYALKLRHIHTHNSKGGSP